MQFDRLCARQGSVRVHSPVCRLPLARGRARQDCSAAPTAKSRTQCCLAQAMGDKLQARKLAEECGVPTVPGTPEAVADVAVARQFVASVGLPVILKAAMVRPCIFAAPRLSVKHG